MADFKKGFRQSDAWKVSREFWIFISRIAKTFPFEERYGLTSQIMRSSRSVTANIAEGYGRFHFQETIQFFRHARGSLFETIDHLITAYDEKYLIQSVLEEAEAKALSAVRLINGYIRFLEKSKRNENNEDLRQSYQHKPTQSQYPIPNT